MKIISRNLRIGRGEIDIVALDRRCLVFCEVKTRTGYQYGDPFEAVTEAKQFQIKKLAEAYISQNRVSIKAFDDVRFDVVSIVTGTPWSIKSLVHIKDAF